MHAAPTTKAETLIQLLRHKDGATLAQMTKATGWQGSVIVMSREQTNRRYPQPQQDLAALVHDLEALAAMDLAQMRTLWSSRLERPYPPNLRSPEIFRGLLGYRLREKHHGGLPVAVRKELRRVEAKSLAGKTNDLAPRLNIGVRLEREWQGTLHAIDVVDGGFRHHDVVYQSLSEVARAITGTRWSGPRFFGLKAST